MSAADGRLWLGAPVDPSTGGRADGRTEIDAADLTTHGVIVGMTGSGKTGLGMVLLEEALLAGVSCLVLDPKGDMGNLLLGFPDLAPADFAPWVEPGDDPAEVASRWRDGLAGWGIDGARIATLRDRAAMRLYTPGSEAGVPLNLVGSLDPPADVTDTEAVRDEIGGYVSGLLGMVGVESDPLSGREHILLAQLVERAWTSGTPLDLGRLLAQVQDPPMRKLGVVDVDRFFPPDDRTDLAMRLNGLLASPAFAAWSAGEPLDIARMLFPDDGRAGAAVVTLAHLSDEERQFVVTLVLSRLVTWMRSQPGSADLRVLVYMDEVFGFVPPTAVPPAKRPILTLVKQARAYGVGMVLATQNPVDLDYKALSNAGTWLVGRLQTERDKARLLDGMASAAGGVDLASVDATITGLDPRQFVLHRTRASEPTVLTTRWAMSYLAGPLTRARIAMLAPPGAVPAVSAVSATPVPAAPATPGPARSPVPSGDVQFRDDETAEMPPVADGVPVRWLDPAAPWAAGVGADPGGTRLEAAVAVRARLLYDERTADLRHTEEWEAVVFPLGAPLGDSLRAVDHDDRDLRPAAPGGARYALPPPAARIHTRTFFRDLLRDVRAHLTGTLTLDLHLNSSLDLWSRPGEDRDTFARRCKTTATEGFDGDAEKLRDTLATRADRVRDAIARAEDRVAEIEVDVSTRRDSDVGDVVGSLVSGLLGGRTGTRSLARRLATGRRQRARAGQRLESARNRLAEKVDDLAELEAELAETLADLDDTWTERAADIETRQIGLERDDVAVDQPVLVWTPRPDR